MRNRRRNGTVGWMLVFGLVCGLETGLVAAEFQPDLPKGDLVSPLKSMTLHLQLPFSATSTIAKEELLQAAFASEARSFEAVDRSDVLTRVFQQVDTMMDRFAQRGLDIAHERGEFEELRKRQLAIADKTDLDLAQKLFFDTRMAKRLLMLRDPALASLEKLLFVKRHAYLPSHNYSDIYDAPLRAGGGVYTLAIPHVGGRLEPAQAKLTMLFDGAKGIARDPTTDFEAQTIYFAFRPLTAESSTYWHLYSMRTDGTDRKKLTDGPFHDYYPCVLPDGGLTFVSTRCRSRFLCWVPMAMTLFRMDGGESSIRQLSFANISEWGPSMMRDGRIIWTRSEYLDKGADYGHTLWSIHPDGTHPELVYGNNSGYNLMNGREVPDSDEICATLISHFGDFNGPIALIDVNKGRFNADSVKIITPDLKTTENNGNFRDPIPITHDYVLVSHKPLGSEHFGMYLIDRWGNRELLYLDGAIDCMTPLLLQAQPRPPVLASSLATTKPGVPGQLAVMDVYEGLGPNVKRGSVKYIRVCQEIRSDLEKLPDGKLKETYPDFLRHYASPIDIVNGPHGWPGYVAKGVLGTAPVDDDGSAYFEIPPGEVVYFQALDKDFNEIQRMRSVMQMQPGEARSCIGCHESRATVGVPRNPTAMRRAPSTLEAPPWGAGPFAYERVVQPVLNAQCVRCHDGSGESKVDLRGIHDQNKVPNSYATLIRGGWVHHFDLNWHLGHNRADPLSFGTAKSKLFTVLADKTHEEVKLSSEELQALKCWIDLNCPLWPDYIHSDQRSDQACDAKKEATTAVTPAKP